MQTLNILMLAFGLSSTANASPRCGHHNHHSDALGRVVVINNSGGSVRFTLDTGESVILANGERSMLRAQPGTRTTRATYRVFGLTQELEAERIRVRPYDTTIVELEPERDAFIRVTNDTRYTANLNNNGYYLTQLSPGESEVVRVPVGSNKLQLTNQRGRLLDEKVLRTYAFSENRWVVDFPETADVTVVNPLPIPVMITGERGRAREIPAYGQVVYNDIPVGTFSLTATRTTGEFIDQQTLGIREHGRNVWTVDAPTTGFLLVDSDHHCGAEIRVDGRRVARLDAGEVEKLEIGVGGHRITVVDDRGRILEDDWVRIDAYRTQRIDAGDEPRAVADNDHQSGRERDERGVRDERGERDKRDGQDTTDTGSDRDHRRGDRSGTR